MLRTQKKNTQKIKLYKSEKYQSQSKTKEYVQT